MFIVTLHYRYEVFYICIKPFILKHIINYTLDQGKVVEILFRATEGRFAYWNLPNHPCSSLEALAAVPKLWIVTPNGVAGPTSQNQPAICHLPPNMSRRTP